MTDQTIGSTRCFVLAKGFTQVGSHAALIGDDDTRDCLLNCMPILIAPMLDRRRHIKRSSLRCSLV
jgi:hypothetical protein